MRLIDADKLVETIVNTPSEVAKIHTYNVLTSLAERQNEILDIVENSPTIEATPVVHGRWMLEGSGHTHYCDRCHDYYTTDADSLYFCPRCGAKMIGVEQPGRNGWKMELVDGELKQVWGVIKERFVKTRTEADFPNCGARMDKED